MEEVATAGRTRRRAISPALLMAVRLCLCGIRAGLASVIGRPCGDMILEGRLMEDPTPFYMVRVKARLYRTPQVGA